jgi:acyl-coenzyme A synthetase/AMP-(fatty) acid ligase
MQFGISECIETWARSRGDDFALSANATTVSYREFNKDIDRISAFIAQRKIGRVGVLCEAKRPCLTSIIGILRAGACAVILHPNENPDSLKQAIEDTAASFVIFDDAIAAQPWFSQLATDACPTIGYKNCRADVHVEAVDSRPESECCILFSSGTTGRSKGIERDHHSMVSESLGWVIELGLGRQTTFYLGRPIYYTGGLVLALATLTSGGCVAFSDLHAGVGERPEWDAYLAACAITKLQWAFFLPDQLRRFIREELPASIEFAHGILTMGAPISGVEKQAIAKRFSCDVIESWGNSESLGTITEPDDIYTRPNSIGRPFVSDKLYILDQDGREAPVGAVGRIAGATEAGFKKYSSLDLDTANAIVGGSIVSDDIGYQDESGYFYLVGRRKEIFKIGDRDYSLQLVEKQVRDIISDLPIGLCFMDKPSPTVGIAVEQPSQSDAAKLTTEISKATSLPERNLRVVFLVKMPRLPSGKLNKEILAQIISGSDHLR